MVILFCFHLRSRRQYSLIYYNFFIYIRYRGGFFMIFLLSPPCLLVTAVEPANLPEEAIANWIESALQYIADGRHLLAKALSATSLPVNRSAEIGAAHRALLAPLTSALTQIGVRDLHYALSMIQSVTDAATKRIENGNSAETEISRTTAFCIAGLRTLI
jgi:hypothetical protein